MRAITQDRLGGPEVLVETTLDRPAPGPTEILVRVHAAGLNPVDVKSRAHGGFLGQPPFVLGWDVSGVVEEVGIGVTLFTPGDEVFGMPWFPRPAGAYAEYVTAPARHFAAKPAGLDHVHAAGLPLAGLTAWQALVDRAEVLPGQRVLIHAAAGGVGHLAVQIAKARGAYVIGTARAGKHELLRELGADEVVDYTAVDFTEAVEPVDVVIDPIGGTDGPRCLRTLRPGGILVSINSPAEQALVAQAAQLGVRAGFLLVEPDRAGLLGLAALVTEGRLRVLVEAEVPLAEAAKAHELSETGRATGKIVLTTGADR
ncbi:NADPH:quinone reductase [Actinoplanes italicus]|uniref:NADPH:quinone reductase-like Zn-dependent oxidoreductase n=1 Tax=Actinoplanes italicus TaxID=113567 RepID=A0A2T0KFT7_9ACTN|nr:NADP-dependent oxidoreductase [Actinoplanes italicus]PRX22245.1 NADPH:quinone reductase-like Zn-dependent oxidoreductase [Actinoplanes italicus]GIE29335.1 NADPH:quinone reductase [Actinoplanes italicus]